MKKILICGGHLSPAIALIEEFEIEKDIIINFIGRKYSTEGEIARKIGLIGAKPNNWMGQGNNAILQVTGKGNNFFLYRRNA